MAKLFIIRTGETTWEKDQRVESSSGAPLSEQGVKQVKAAARDLQRHEIRAVYAGTGEAEIETARLLGKSLKLKVKKRAGLREIDYGLWQGLTLKEIKHRQPKVYRQWQDDPASAKPPGGETLEQAADRLKLALRDILKRHKDEAILLTLRPVALGLALCLLKRDSISSLWKNVSQPMVWASYEADSKSL